ncbi:unnamed protein product [Leptidea sinapis]|uniref:Uncharacterized protein n=1 Tax=Leptidea sinapis TaxID=189913 RepID=A0A5E4QLH6_9NEOP|nr:unnamed protein product [Leptidea sinapis]
MDIAGVTAAVGNAPVIPLVLKENMRGGDHLTPGDPYARLSYFTIKKEKKKTNRMKQ